MKTRSSFLVVLDFDGTSSDSKLIPRVHSDVATLLEAAVREGWSWAINSDRSLTDLQRVARELHINSRPLALVARRQIFMISVGNGNYQPHIEWNEKCSVEQRELERSIAPFTAECIKYINKNFRVRLDLSNKTRLEFVVFPEDVGHLRDEMKRFLQNIQVAQISCNRESCIVIHRESCKGKSTIEMAKILGMSTSRVGAIGDAVNDLPMLDPATSAVAGCPGDACPEVKRLIGTRTQGVVAHSPGPLGTVEILQEWMSDLSLPYNSCSRRQNEQSND